MPATQAQPHIAQVDITTDKQGQNGVTNIATFYDFKMGIMKVLDDLGLKRERRATFNEDKPGEYRHSKYKNSGLWHRFSDTGDKSMLISVDVGCSCSHDCCGHVCRLHYEIRVIDQHILVITETAINI